MDQEAIIEKTAEYVQKELQGESSGHDWWHVHRVWKSARKIGLTEKQANLFVVELAALLHDIADWKFYDGDLSVGPRRAREWLAQLNVSFDITNKVAEIIEQTSFKGIGVKGKTTSLEAKIVQDADRLDAIGAIGIARAFAYGGAKGREIYNPHIKPEYHENAEQYARNKSPTINHFHEKLLHLKNLMNTGEGKKLAEARHSFMQGFLEVFLNECEI